MDKKLEARVTRLEKLLKVKSESRLPDIGETVEDVNGDIAKVIDFGTLEDMYAKYKGRILNDEEVRDFVNVDGTSNYIPWEEWVAVIKYRDFNGMSIVTDPKYGLEIIESKKVVNKLVKNEGYFEDIDELSDFVERYVMDELSADYRWERDERDDGIETSKAYERAFKRLANKRAPELIDEIMKSCADEFELEPEEVEEYRGYITDRAAIAAEDCLDTYFKYAESRARRNKRTLRESRRRRPSHR